MDWYIAAHHLMGRKRAVESDDWAMTTPSAERPAHPAMLDRVRAAVPWSSRLLSSFHVVRVSIAWLRMHELESAKRGTDW